MTTNTHSNKAGNPPGTGKSGPATRSHDAHITSEKEALTHLKNSTILGEDDSHSTIQGIAAALRRYAGLIKPANSLGALDIRKTMSSLALLLELADPKDKESAADQLKDAVTRAVDEAKEELKKTVQEEMAKMRTIAEATNTTVTENLAGLQNASTSQPAKPSYSSIAAGAISADARLVAQRAIQDRQVLLKIDPDDTNGGALRYEMDIPSTKKTLQSEIDKLNPKYKIRLVQKTRERGILIEMASEEGAEWLRTSMKNSELARTLGATVKDRQHHVLVKFVPITFDETKEMQDVLDDNDIDPKFYIKARWIKPVHRRRPEQRFGHMVFSFNNRDQANEIRIRGIIIHSQKRDVERLKDEPTRCLKCHRYGHIARNCIADEDTCGTCGETGHRTNACTIKDQRYCVSCQSDGHSSWDRGCPVFLRKCEEYDRRHPENTLPYFPSTEPWTWAPGGTPNIITKPATQHAKKMERKQKLQAKNRQTPQLGGDEEAANEETEDDSDMYGSQ
ncbi:hypothetical protein D9613_001545 [Agrocybe pediades]|uniref:CCHC-type domain-containing protein n=1 Tax=Agrocybe pediades TaxID=84607 RepID=A0A8H4VU89_9AGAR|nr:hypothetical protein D9613_001545 [Agrocybe pediades]